MAEPHYLHSPTAIAFTRGKLNTACNKMLAVMYSTVILLIILVGAAVCCCVWALIVGDSRWGIACALCLFASFCVNVTDDWLRESLQMRVDALKIILEEQEKGYREYLRGENKS